MFDHWRIAMAGAGSRGASVWISGRLFTAKYIHVISVGCEPMIESTSRGRRL